MRVVRAERYKLHVYPKINHTLLFDLEKDPNEMYNLASKPLYSEEVADLTELMKRWQKTVGDPRPYASPTLDPKKSIFERSSVH